MNCEEERDSVSGIDPKKFFLDNFGDAECYAPFIVTSSSEISEDDLSNFTLQLIIDK